MPHKLNSAALSLLLHYFFLAVVVIGYETTATARWALLFIVRAFFNDTITVAVWTGFHACASWDATTPTRFISAGALRFGKTVGVSSPHVLSLFKVVIS
jgi:hypothetical protein